MLCPVVCFSCGKSLDAYFKAFKEIRQKKMRDLEKDHPDKIKPNMIPVSDELQPVLGEDLDAMGFTLECCRMNILTTVEFLALEN